MNRRLTGIVVLFITCTVLYGAMTTINIEESIALTLENNKELKSEKASVSAASWQQASAFANFLPQISFNATMVRLDDDTYEKANQLFQLPVLDSSYTPTGDFVPMSMGSALKTSYKTGITASQPLFVGGKIFTGYQLSRYNRMLSENTELSKINETKYQVISLYFAILKLQDLHELIEKSVVSAETKLKHLELQQEMGMAKKADYLQWQVRLKEYEKSAKEIRFNLSALLEVYNNFMGFSEVLYTPAKIDYRQYDSEITDLSEVDDNEFEAFLDRSVRDLEQNNPTLRNLELSTKMLKLNKRMAGSNFLPNLFLQFNYEFENDDKLDFSGDKMWNFAAVLSMPLFQGGKNYADYRKSVEELKKTQYTTSFAKEHFQRETRRISRELVLQAMNVKNMESAFEYADENYTILLTLVEQDMAPNSTLLDAEALIFNSEINLISSYYEYLTTKFELEKYISFQEIK